MRRVNNKDITSVVYNGIAIQTIMFGASIIWQAIRSCFGSGYWINGKPWINEEPWKNN